MAISINVLVAAKSVDRTDYHFRLLKYCTGNNYYNYDDDDNNNTYWYFFLFYIYTYI